MTRKQIRYALPAQAGAMLQVVVDKDQNIDFSIIWGAFFGKMEATTRRLHMYPTPTPDNGIYGLDVDQEGNMWGAGWQKGTINKWDAKTEIVTEYKVPRHSAIVKLDPRANRWTFYPMPQPNQSLPKFELAADNTLWFGSRGVPLIAAVHFYPNGYTPDNLPLP